MFFDNPMWKISPEAACANALFTATGADTTTNATTIATTAFRRRWLSMFANSFKGRGSELFVSNPGQAQFRRSTSSMQSQTRTRRRPGSCSHNHQTGESPEGATALVPRLTYKRALAYSKRGAEK